MRPLANAAPWPADRLYWRRSTRLLPWRATRTERSARRNRFAAHCVMPVRPATTFSAALSSVCDHAGYTPALAQAADAAALVETIRAASLGDPGPPHGPSRHRRSKRRAATNPASAARPRPLPHLSQKSQPGGNFG